MSPDAPGRPRETPRLGIYPPPDAPGGDDRVSTPRPSCWLVGGYRARVFIWDGEEYDRAGRPADAQPARDGLWVALRFE